jgi:hypothetical protein
MKLYLLSFYLSLEFQAREYDDLNLLVLDILPQEQYIMQEDRQFQCLKSSTNEIKRR